MQNQNKPDYPRPVAAFSKYTLVQFDLENFFLLHGKELKNVHITPESDLPNFSPDKHKKKLSGISVDKVIDRQIQTYGTRNLEVFIFRIKGEKEKIWLSKSAFADAVKDVSGKAFKSKASSLTYNEWKAKNEESHQSNDDTVMADAWPPIQSVDVQNHDRASSFPSTTPNAHQTTSRTKGISEDREQSWTRDDLLGESGETPEPRDGGQVIYGIDCTFFGKPKIRGLVHRNDAYEFEELSYCSSKQMIPNQKAGMAPKADNEFVSKMKKEERSYLKIIGCAAKWHGKLGKQVLVILKITDPTLLKRLNQDRSNNGYKYKGPLVCSLSRFRRISEKEDTQELEDYLRMTKFAMGLAEEDISLKKGNKKQSKADEGTKEMIEGMRNMQVMMSNGFGQMLQEIRATE